MSSREERARLEMKEYIANNILDMLCTGICDVNDTMNALFCVGLTEDEAKAILRKHGFSI